MIRPPPGPPPTFPGFTREFSLAAGETRPVAERPEEPAKYIYELPRLAQAEISTSAVVCGNWMAQLRQVFIGLSPTAVSWWSSVEAAASTQYQKRTR